jgi:hypothetical protein
MQCSFQEVCVADPLGTPRLCRKDSERNLKASGDRSSLALFHWLTHSMFFSAVLF